MAIKLFSHGACQEVTGSKHFLDIDGRLLQIDCGMFQGRRAESYQKNRQLPFDPKAVSALILTHAHFDHSGALPILLKNGYGGDIHATSATRDVAQIILLDSANIQLKDYEILQEKSAKHPERELTSYPPLYSPEEAVAVMASFVTSGYHHKFRPLDGVEAEFFDAGHILGAATVHLTIQDRLRVGFSGDLGRCGLPIIRDPEIMPPMDYLVLEGTYGNRLHKSIGLASDELAELMRKAQARRGKIIIPAFTIERTQELIYIIHALQQEGKVPILPIFIDSPMAVNATAIFKVHPECFDEETIRRFTSVNVDPFGFENIRYVVSTEESKTHQRFRRPGHHHLGQRHGRVGAHSASFDPPHREPGRHHCHCRLHGREHPGPPAGRSRKGGQDLRQALPGEGRDRHLERLFGPCRLRGDHRMAEAP